MVVVSTQDAKANFPDLLERVLAGEEVLITASGTLVARLQPVHGQTERRFGTGRDTLTFVEGWDDPMSEEELADWYGKDQ